MTSPVTTIGDQWKSAQMFETKRNPKQISPCKTNPLTDLTDFPSPNLFCQEQGVIRNIVAWSVSFFYQRTSGVLMAKILMQHCSPHQYENASIFPRIFGFKDFHVETPLNLAAGAGDAWERVQGRDHRERQSSIQDCFLGHQLALVHQGTKRRAMNKDWEWCMDLY